MKYSAIGFLILVMVLFTSNQSYSQVNVSDEVYSSVDKMPRLKGAGKNVSQHVRKQVDYSDDYKMRGVEGEIWLSFVVTKFGGITDIEIEKGIDSQLDEEVVKVLLAQTNWKPGEIDKQVVNTQMRLPIQFELTNGERDFAQQLKMFNSSEKRPLFILDNKLINGIVKIEDYNVESIRVIKGNKAIKLYGEKGENGVVVITSKNGTPPLY